MMEVRARHIDGDLWQVSLPRRKSAIKGRDGMRPRRNVHAADEADAIRQGAEIFARELAAYKMGTTMNLADLASFFLDHAAASGELSRETADDYKAQIARYVEPHFAIDADKATPMDIEQLYTFLLSSGGRDGQGISARTVRKLDTALRRAYALIKRESPAVGSPMHEVRPPSVPSSARRSLTEREFAKVASALDRALSEAPEDRRGIRRRNQLFAAYLLMHTGMRVSEACALVRGDVRASERAVRVEHAMSDKGGLRRKRPKTGSSRRTVALDADAWAALVAHFEWQRSYLTARQRDSDATPVCCTATGGFLSPKATGEAFKAFCAEAAEVTLEKGASIHTLRHTHATQLLANKANPKAVQHRLGHSRASTTLDNYAHVMAGEDAAMAEDFGEIARRARDAGGIYE